MHWNLSLEQAPLPERRRQHERLSHGRAEDGAAVNQLFQLHRPFDADSELQLLPARKFLSGLWRGLVPPRQCLFCFVSTDEAGVQSTDWRHRRRLKSLPCDKHERRLLPRQLLDWLVYGTRGNTKLSHLSLYWKLSILWCWLFFEERFW